MPSQKQAGLTTEINQAAAQYTCKELIGMRALPLGTRARFHTDIHKQLARVVSEVFESSAPKLDLGSRKKDLGHVC